MNINSRLEAIDHMMDVTLDLAHASIEPYRKLEGEQKLKAATEIVELATRFIKLVDIFTELQRNFIQHQQKLKNDESNSAS